MALYPTTPFAQMGYGWAPEWGTVIAGPFDSGRYTARPSRRRQLHTFQISYAKKLWDDLRPVVDFFNARQGRANTFTLKDFNGSRVWVGLFVGIGTGAQTVFDLPMFSATARTIKSNGSALSEGGGGPQWVFGSGTGTDGRDKATFNTAPTAGVLLTLDATGILGAKVRFASDRLPIQTWRNDPTAAYIQTGGIVLIEQA